MKLSFTSLFSRRNLVRGLALGVVAAAAIVVTGGFDATDAHADGGFQVVTLRNKATGFALDSNANRDVYAERANTGAYQKWVLEPSGDGYFFLRNDATHFVLDSNADRDVYTMMKNGGSYQQWKFIRTEGGFYVLRNKATGFVLDSNGDRDVYTMGNNNGSYQQWRLTITQP